VLQLLNALWYSTVLCSGRAGAAGPLDLSSRLGLETEGGRRRSGLGGWLSQPHMSCGVNEGGSRITSGNELNQRTTQDFPWP
jgi:hypothetical protein